MVAPQPFFRERGTPIAVRLLVETLCGLGHRVDLLVYHDGDPYEHEGVTLIRAARPPGVRTVPIGISVAKLACDAMLVARMLGLLRRRRYDVIHAVEEAVFPAVAVARLARCPIVYDMDSSLAEQLVQKWRWLRPLAGALTACERAAVRRAYATVAVCEDLAAKVRPWVGADRVLVLPDVPFGAGQPPSRVERLRELVSPGATIALYVGNLERYQGIELLLDALARLPAATRVEALVIGGSAAEVARHEALAEARGLGRRVRLLGARPLAALGSLLEQADILLSPRTLGQNTPMKIYSYMQSGRAILATDIRSHTQALDASCAWLAAPTPAAYAAGLERLAEDPALRVRLGHVAHERAERDYSVPGYRRKVGQLYARFAG